MTGTTVFGCLPGAHPYWTQKSFKIEQFYIYNRLNKGKDSWSMLPLRLLAAMMIMMCYWMFWGTLGKCYVSNPVAKTLVWIENHDWHACFWMPSWGSPLLDPQKLPNQQQFFHNRLNKEKTPGRCCQSGCLLP